MAIDLSEHGSAVAVHPKNCDGSQHDKKSSAFN